MVERTRQILHLVAPSGEARVGHEIVVGGERTLAIPTGRTMIPTFGVQAPTLSLVVEVGHHDLVEHLLVHGRILDRCHHFDTAIQVARHPVGRRDEDARFFGRQRFAVREGDDARMLQEAADDALDPDGLGEALHAGPKTADAADHEVDGHAGAARLIKGVDDLRVDERVQLGPDAGRLGRALACSASRAISVSRSCFIAMGE